MNKLYAAAGLITVLGLAAYGLVQYGRALERADNNELVADLQSSLAALGLEIQKQEGAAADNLRKAIDANREKIDAIENNDHQTAEVKRLEQLIKRERAKAQDRESDSAARSAALHYRVVVTDAVKRVWEEGRSCSGLPASERASVLQKRLPAVAGDDITELIKYAQREYCACGLQYNQLWRTAERLADECNKKRPQ